MAQLLSAFNTVMMLATLLAVGWLAAWKVKLTDQQYKLVAELVVIIAIPAMLFTNTLSNITPQVLMDGMKYMAIGFVILSLLLICSSFVAKWLKIPQSRKGLFCILCSLSNSVLIGLPVCVGFYGEEAISFVMFFYIPNTIIFWTYGSYLINRDAGKADNKFSIKLLAKNLLTAPALLGFFAGLIVVFTKLQLPKFLLDSVGGIGAMSTPLSMIYIGMTLYRSGFKIKLEWAMLALLAFRFVIAPASMLVSMKAFSLPYLGSTVMVLQAAMPTMTQSSVVAGRVGADAEYAAKVTAITTILCLFTSPIISMLVRLFYT